MGTIRNEMTIVHHYNKDKLEEVREDAVRVFSQVIRQDAGTDEYYIGYMISPIMKTYMNEEYTFVINGDCSKVGWETAERFHEARMKWCERHCHDVQNIVVINFGENVAPSFIVFDKWESEEKGKMADIKLIVKLDEEEYINIKNAINSLIEHGVNRASMSKVCLAILDGTPLEEESIPYLMHKELDVPISECQKAYDVAIDYLRSQGKIKG